MELTEKENAAMIKIFRSQYGWLPVTEHEDMFSVEEKTAQCLETKKLVEYALLGTKKFVRLTKIGIAYINEVER